MKTITIQFDENDYTLFDVSASDGNLYGSGEFEMKPSGTNLPANVFIEFSNGAIWEVKSSPHEKISFMLMSFPDGITGSVEHIKLRTKIISFDADVRWVKIWGDWPPTRDELLSSIEGMALEEIRMLSLDYTDVLDIHNRMFTAMMEKHWEQKLRQAKNVPG